MVLLFAKPESEKPDEDVGSSTPSYSFANFENELADVAGVDRSPRRLQRVCLES